MQKSLDVTTFMNGGPIVRYNQPSLTSDSVLAAYDDLVPLYGGVPPLVLWRAWELAAYRRYSLAEPVLDLGCGDGRFFRKAFPQVRNVLGVDFNPGVAAHAAFSGIYRGVVAARSDSLPLRREAFKSVFANCSLEHMDRLDAVLGEVASVLQPGGTFLMSVVTREFVAWAPLAKLLRACGSPETGAYLQQQHESYHHLVNPLPISEWHERLSAAGFDVVDEIPIVAGAAGHTFLLLDQLWHLQTQEGELGQEMLAWLEQTPRSIVAMRQVLQGLLTWSSSADEYAGVVLLARKPKAGGADRELVESEPIQRFANDKLRACWCGNTTLARFNSDYGRCEQCETLVLIKDTVREMRRVVDDEQDFYGRDYWFGHQAKLGHVDIEKRARKDLIERCLYWLRAVVRYRRPPSSALELGCAHGAFVALLRSAGFDAQGLELSPSIADFARRTFDIPVLVGPVEDQQELGTASLDLVFAMDVLEHLEDPLGTLSHCAGLLGADGTFVLQTPCYPEGATYEELLAAGSEFLAMLQPEEHIYLFSRTSIRTLFQRLGFGHLVFEPAIFEHYDMFAFGSRAPLAAQAPGQGVPSLSATKDARFVQGLLDLDEQIAELRRMLAVSSADVAHLTSEFERVQHDPHPTDFDWNQVRERLRVSEADRAARLDVIERQGHEVAKLSAEVDRWHRQTQDLYARVNDLENERNRVQQDADDLQNRLYASEADRAARLELIERQGSELGRVPALEADVEFLKGEITKVNEDRAARLDVIEHQGQQLARIPELEADLAYLANRVAKSEEELARARDSVQRAKSEVSRLQIRIAMTRNSKAYRILRRFGLLGALRSADSSPSE